MKTASSLRNRALAMPEGAFLGSEEELIAQLGVSRPTFRQAARLVSHEQLITIKRGVGGGFFARRPSKETVGRAVATYLRSRDTTLEQVLDVSYQIGTIALELAAKSSNQMARERLVSLRAKIADALSDAPTKAHRAAALLALEFEQAEIIGLLTGNPAIELCMDMFDQFGAYQTSVRFWAEHPERVGTWLKVSLRLVDALLAGDAEQAKRVLQERGRLSRRWVADGQRERLDAAANTGAAGR